MTDPYEPEVRGRRKQDREANRQEEEKRARQRRLPAVFRRLTSGTWTPDLFITAQAGR